jgi:hypothetical protein
LRALRKIQTSFFWHQVVNPRHPTHCSLCSMSWSCRGSLYDDGTYLNNDVPNCFANAAKLMGIYNVDILWLNDARITAGTLERHLHLLQDALPDSFYKNLIRLAFP